MDQIAFIVGSVFIYWSSIILTMAAAVAVCTFLALYLRKTENVTAAAIAVPCAMILSLVLARLMHWYCRADSYASFGAAMTDYSSGGYALLGVFAGCSLTALILRLTKFSKNLPEMLDCMCLAGGAGIALGRLAAFFNSSDRGQVVASVKSLPWVYPVTNVVSGVQEYRLATFLIQAMVTAVIFIGVFAFYWKTQRNGKGRAGDTSIIFLLCYGASQVVLDSTRYDSLFFRSNGFVSIVQVLGALAIGLALAVFSFRLIKKHGFEKKYLGYWIPIAVLLGLGGYMEYHVQRHGDQAIFAYTVMSLCLIGLVVFNLGLYRLAEKEKVAE